MDLSIPIYAKINRCSYNKVNNLNCKLCSNLNDVEYELEVQLDLKMIKHKVLIACCETCHNQNCPFHVDMLKKESNWLYIQKEKINKKILEESDSDCPDIVRTNRKSKNTDQKNKNIQYLFQKRCNV
jgi:hypothetical protein